MRTKIIEKAPQKMLIEALKGERTFEEIDGLDSIAEKEWLNLYQSVKNETCDCIHWDDAPVASQSGSIFRTGQRLIFCKNKASIDFPVLAFTRILFVSVPYGYLLRPGRIPADSENVERLQRSRT